MTWTLPNILTVLRLAAAPGVALMFLYFDRPYADWFALVLFVSAAITEWFDGFLARAWKQETKLGAMLDPIADKAMVVIALMVIVGYSTMSPWLVLPATVILFREVFVSGLREFLGETAGTLKVTKLAKWKTTAQMVAIATLFSQGVFEHFVSRSNAALDRDAVHALLQNDQIKNLPKSWAIDAMVWSGQIGLALLWIAAVLTFLTGLDYFNKAKPFLRDDR